MKELWDAYKLPVLTIFAVIMFILVIFTFGIVNVDPTEVAVEVSKIANKVKEKPQSVGYHFYNRWMTDMIIYKVSSRSYPADTMKSEKEDKYTLSLKTNDGQNVSVDLTVIYALNSQEVPNLHAQVGKNYEDQILLPQIRSASRISIGGYSAEEIYQGKVRDEIQTEVKNKLVAAMEKFPAIQVQEALMRDFSFSADFEKAIEQKKLAAQQVEINKNKALAQEEEAKRQEAEARGGKLKAIQEAEGKAKSAKIAADAERYKLEQEAKGQLAKYKAEAEGKRLAAAALGSGQNVVALEFARQLAPKLQVIGIPVGEQTTNLMDLSGFTKGLFKVGATGAVTK